MTDTNTTFSVDTDTAYHLTSINDGSIWVVTAHSKGWYTVECVECDDPDLANVGDEKKVRAKQISTEVVYHKTGDTWSAVMPTAVTDEPNLAVTESDNDEAADDDDDEDELTPGKLMARTLHSYAIGYVTIVNASGDKSKVCGDWLSQLLAPLTPEQVARVASEILGLSVTLYDHLNPGQVRMNWGNRLRAKVKRGELTQDVVEDTLSSLEFASDEGDDESEIADQAHVDDGERMYG